MHRNWMSRRLFRFLRLIRESNRNKLYGIRFVWNVTLKTIFWFKLIVLCLFRTTSRGAYTNRHWVCSLIEEDNWFARDFDDSTWENAVVRTYESTYTTSSFWSGYDDAARLIWHSNVSYIGPIYCRTRLGFRKYHFKFEF